MRLIGIQEFVREKRVISLGPVSYQLDDDICLFFNTSHYCNRSSTTEHLTQTKFVYNTC